VFQRLSSTILSYIPVPYHIHSTSISGMEDSLSIVDPDLLSIEDPDSLEKVIKLMELIPFDIATSSLSQLRIFFGIGIFLLYLLILIFGIALVVMGRTLRRQSW